MVKTSEITGMYYIAAFYKFIHLNNLEQIQSDLENKAKELGILGLWILGPEGINSTLAAPSESQMKAMQEWIRAYFNIPDLAFKNSQSQQKPFRRFVVKVRPEIVTLKTPELFPESIKNHHLSPTEWNRVLKEEDDFLLVDTRNWYEYKIGTFKGAVNPDIDVFTEFPKFIEQNQLPKDKKMLIFCTGGIRCEKGILELQSHGYNNVYQLEGGILKYLEEYPNDQFTGECFVFDLRVAVDQNLKPTLKFRLCPHCGQPGSLTINCNRCDYEMVICEDCAEIEFKKDACSKHCAHHLERFPNRKGKHQIRTEEMARV